MSVLVPTKFPSVAAVMLASVASLLLLLLAYILYAFMRLSSCPAISISTSSNEKTRSWLTLFSPPNSWSLSFHSALPSSLPFSLTIPEKPSPEVGTGAGVGLSSKALGSLPISWKLRRPGPQFQSPPPTLYQSSAPLSMAKLIMSRHTFRRPNPNRPRRLSSASSSRSPQPSSQLFHSIA